jgi:YesN/AraC family two-component response regulator
MEIDMSDSDNHIVITDIKMPFMSMVVFMIKWAIAAIPAIIILSLLAAFVAGILGGLAA